MTKSTTIKRALLRSGSAFQALALLGAGLTTSVIMAAPAAAQDFTNVTASGRVTGADGAPLSGATVTVTSNAQGFSRTATTDSGGVYRIPTLPQGVYTFEVAAPGFSTFRDDNVNLTQSTGGNSFRLVSGDATADGDDIVVRGERVQVSDFDRTTTGAVIQIGELATRVPVARDLTSVILLAPGTSQGDTAFGNLAAVSGSSVSENTFFLNGLNITDFRQGLGSVTVPFEFYNTVEVKNGGIPAEFGRFTGGFINATTKSGGNEFHGKVLFTWQPDETYSDAPNTLGNYNQEDTFERLETIFTLSGPIIKDRLFFYGFYQANNVTQGDTLTGINPNTVLLPGQIDPRTGQAVTVNTTVAPFSTGLRREERSSSSPFYGGKIDAIITDGHRLEATYFDSTQTTLIDNYNIVDGTGRPCASTNIQVAAGSGCYNSLVDTGAPVAGTYAGSALLTGGGENYIGRYTGQFTDWLTVSGAYGVNKRLQVTGSTQDDYPFIADTTGGGRFGNAVNVINDNNDRREFYRGDVDLYFNIFGSHHIKAGYDRENLTTNAQTRYTGGVAWTYVNSGATGDVYNPNPNDLYVTGRTFINGGEFKSENEAFYIQDSWSLFDNRLTLNFGVRNDRFTNFNVAGEAYYESGDQWAPRLAFTADPFGDGTTKIYGSFGRYYLPVVANTNIRLAGAELDYTRYFRVAGVNPDNTPILGAPLLGFADAAPCPDTGVANCDIISDGEPTPTESTVAKDLKPQSVDEYILGIERSLGKGIRVGVFGQHRSLNESLEDVAIDAAVLAYCDAEGITGCDDIFTGFHQYVLVNPGAPARITLSDPINGETSLRTVDFSAEDLGYPRARRTYTAVTVTFDRDFDGVWSLNGSYTWSESKGNIEGGIRSDNGQTDSGLTTAFDQPGLVDGTYGFLPGDARHKFKLYGSYQVTDWFNVGAQFQAISPRKFGCIGRVPVQRDPFAGAYGAAGYYCNVDSAGDIITDPNFQGFSNTATGTSLSITPRGSQRESDWNIFTNLSANFRVPTDVFEGSFRVDVFNVFNQKGVLDLNEVGTQGNGRPRGDFGVPTVYQTPRFFRFQLAVGF